MRNFSALIFSGLLIFSSSSSQAEPYIPASDEEIIETLPRPPGFEKITELSQQHKQDPANIVIGDQLVEAYIAMGKKEADPRYYGYAQAVLDPYIKNITITRGEKLSDADAVLMNDYANILQHQHKFEKSLDILNDLIEAKPLYDQPKLLRGIILVTEGKYQEALSDCHSTLKTSGLIIGTTCITTIESMTGKLKKSFEQLKTIYSQFSASASDDEKSWGLAALGEMAARSGSVSEAEEYYKQALVLNPRDYYILAAYADLLLEQKRNAEVVRLLSDYTRLDNLLLRLAMAEKELNNSAKTEEYSAMLEARLTASRERREILHMRDFARFALEFRHDSSQALELARENWKTQREPADSYILIDAALAANDKKAAQEVLDWLAKNSFEDVHLAKYKSVSK